MTKASGPQDSRKYSIWLIASAALIPLVLFAIFQLGFTAQEQRRLMESEAASTAQQLIATADGEVGRIAAILEVLATSNAAKEGNWNRLATRFAEIRAYNPDLKGLQVRTGENQILFSTGTPIARLTRIANGGRADRPLLVGYVHTPQCRCLMFEQMVFDKTGNRHVFTLLTDAGIFLKLLPPGRKRYEVASINDPKGRFIARSLDSDRRFGTLGSEYLRRAVFSGKMAGTYRGFTLEGFENYTAFARSRKTGWTAQVAMSTNYIDGPARQYIISLSVAGLLSLVLAGLLIAFAVRQLNTARRMSERLQQAQKLEALGQLTGGIAHDFNNLLTPIVGTLDLLRRRETLDERGRKLAAGAYASAERAAKLTGQLLTFSRRQQLQIAPVDLAALAADLKTLVERAYGTDHHFEIEHDERAQCVASDANQLELALLNLALNARDASPQGGTIRLLIVPDESKGSAALPDVLFRMVDEGAGMDTETKSRALEPFFTTKPVGRGTGLGLAQVLGVVEQSGGSIAIDSAPGSGTMVTLRLPGCAAPLSEAAKPAPAAFPANEQPLRLLLIDDDHSVRATTARILEEAGHSVDSVMRGTTGLAALSTEPFDLVIVDYLMPEMNGAEFLSQARIIRPDLKALVISGFSDTEALASVGLDTTILSKPFGTARLLEAVNRAASD